MVKDIKNHPLYEEAVQLQDSLEWWRKETTSVIKEASELESKIENDIASQAERDRAKELEPKLRYLLSKGEFEQKSLDNFEEKLNRYEVNKAFFDKINKKKI